MNNSIKVISSIFLLVVFSATSHATDFQLSYSQRVATEIDNNRMTMCPYNTSVVGMSGGFGHSSAYNEPHDLLCGELADENLNVLEMTGQCVSLFTGVDSNTFTFCPDNSVMVGLSGGFGHSSAYNEPHEFTCCLLREANTSRNHFFLETKVDNDEMTSCPNGFAITGLKGGYGHSSAYNVPHEIRCTELEK